jgi:hypothetical protein
MNEPLPCPYPDCGAAAKVDVVGPLYCKDYFVTCTSCQAMGPSCDTEAEAIAAWNSVAELKTTSAERDVLLATCYKALEMLDNQYLYGEAFDLLENITAKMQIQEAT